MMPLTFGSSGGFSSFFGVCGNGLIPDDGERGIGLGILTTGIGDGGAGEFCLETFRGCGVGEGVLGIGRGRGGTGDEV